jgi:WD40 repeat protein/serine/threonine protein kinase
MSDSPLPVAAARRVDEIADRFEIALLAGARPLLEDYLKDVGNLELPALLAELLRLEVEHRLQNGERPSEEEYRQRFPSHAHLLAPVFSEAPTIGGATGGPKDWPVLPGYEILEVLGHGGMGIVYKARQLSLNRTVALKMILAGQLAQPAEIERFRVEAEATANLDHPHIVPIYEVGAHDGRHYFSMKLIEGGSLANRLAHASKSGTQAYDPCSAARLVVKLARAVHHAHQRGILHRDLKPGNILLDASGEPHITDFGLAKRVDQPSPDSLHHLTRSGMVMGTPSYMAPEQARAEKVLTTAADVYSLGAILYEMITGRPPFRGSTWLETLRQVQEEEPVGPRRYQRALPRDLDIICLTCLHKERERRYASAQALADDLQHFLNGEPIRARPLGVWETLLRWGKRRPAAAALVIVSMLAMVGLVAGIWWHVVSLRHSLYASLTDQVRALHQARNSGYQNESWKLLQQALALEPERKNELRLEAAACLGDFVGAAPMHWDSDTEIYALALHPEGALLALGLDNGNVRLRDLHTGQDVANLAGHGARVGSLAFEANGRRLLSGEIDGTVQLWEFEGTAWRPTKRFTIPALSTDSRLEGRAIAATFSPDGRTVAGCSSSNSSVFLWNPTHGAVIDRLPMRALEVPTCLAFSPDNKFLAVGCNSDESHVLAVWDMAGKHRLDLPELPLLDWVSEVAFSPDGKHLAVAANAGGIVLLRVPHFDPGPAMGGDYPGGVAFSPDGQFVAIPANHAGHVRLWNLASNRERAVLDHPGRPRWVAFTADGNTLVTAGARSVRIWNLAGGGEKRVIAGHDRGIAGVVFHPQGRVLTSAGADKVVKVWDADTGSHIGTLDGFSDKVESVAFSSDGRLFAAGDWGGNLRFWEVGVRFWEIASWRELTPLRDLGGPLMCVAFSPDGRLFAACSDKSDRGGVRLWRRHDNGRLDRPTHLCRKPTRSLCFAPPDGKLLAWVETEGNRLCLWDVEADREMTAPPAALAGNVRSLAFLPDGRHLIFVGLDSSPKVWGVDSGQFSLLAAAGLGTRGGSALRNVIALSSDGRWLAQQGRAINIWDLDTRRLLLVLQERQGLPWCFAFSPDRNRLAVGLSDGGLVVWDLSAVRTRLAEIGLEW